MEGKKGRRENLGIDLDARGHEWKPLRRPSSRRFRASRTPIVRGRVERSPQQWNRLKRR